MRQSSTKSKEPYVDESIGAVARLVIFEAVQRARIEEDFQRRFTYYLMGDGDGTNAFEVGEHAFMLESTDGRHADDSD